MIVTVVSTLFVFGAGLVIFSTGMNCLQEAVGDHEDYEVNKIVFKVLNLTGGGCFCLSMILYLVFFV